MNEEASNSIEFSSLNEDVSVKQCTKCLQLLPFEKFSKNAKNKDGYRYACKICEKKAAAEHYQRNKARITKQVVEWQQQNLDKTKEYKRTYYRRKKDES